MNEVSEPFRHVRDERPCGIFRSDENGYFRCDGCAISVHFTELHPEHVGQRVNDNRPEWDHRLKMPPPQFVNQKAIETQKGWRRNPGFEEIPEAPKS